MFRKCISVAAAAASLVMVSTTAASAAQVGVDDAAGDYSIVNPNEPHSIGHASIDAYRFTLTHNTKVVGRVSIRNVASPQNGEYQHLHFQLYNGAGEYIGAMDSLHNGFSPVAWSQSGQQCAGPVSMWENVDNTIEVSAPRSCFGAGAKIRAVNVQTSLEKSGVGRLSLDNIPDTPLVAAG